MHAQTRIILLSAALALGACSVYRPEVRQGNYVDPVKWAQVKAGMTREQVRFLLGPPMIADAFHHAQWDYFYWVESQYVQGGEVKRHLVVRFDGDVVSSVADRDRAFAAPTSPGAQAPTDTKIQKLFEVPAAAPAAAPVEKPAAAPVEAPAATPPAETPPAETPPAETPPAETPPAETPPADTPPTETPPAETAPAEGTPLEPAAPAAVGQS